VEQILSSECHFLCRITDDGQSQQTTESENNLLPQLSNTITIPSKCQKDKNIFPKNVPPEFPFAVRWNTQNRYTQWYNTGLLWLKTVSFQRIQFQVLHTNKSFLMEDSSSLLHYYMWRGKIFEELEFLISRLFDVVFMGKTFIKGFI
jgi:hypothetical protein